MCTVVSYDIFGSVGYISTADREYGTACLNSSAISLGRNVQYNVLYATYRVELINSRVVIEVKNESIEVACTLIGVYITGEKVSNSCY